VAVHCCTPFPRFPSAIYESPSQPSK
jgi:hypothetical protein